MSKTVVKYVRLTKEQDKALDRIASDSKFEIAVSDIIRVAIDEFVARYEQEKSRVAA